MRAVLNPASVELLEREFPDRPHPLGKQHRYFMFMLDGQAVGYVGLGYGIRQAELLRTLFTDPPHVSKFREFVRTYCRSTYKNAPSQMLGLTLKLLKRDTKLQFIYTTGAGYQGLTGRIYQAANFKYIGSFDSYMYFIPGVGYIHARSSSTRYAGAGLASMRSVFPTLVRRNAPIFRYIYFLRDEAELMARAKFVVQPYPARENILVRESDGTTERTLTFDQCYAPIVTLGSRSTVSKKL